jgi:hypothetical protein
VTALQTALHAMLDIFSIQPKNNAKSVQLKSQIVYYAMKVIAFNVRMDM